MRTKITRPRIGILAWLLGFFLLLLAVPTALPGGSEHPARTAEPSRAAPQTQETQESPPEVPEDEFIMPPPQESGVPDDYLEGRGYLGNFPDAWATDILSEPVSARVFLAAQGGAAREALVQLDVPDLDLALSDLIAARMIRESGGVFRPAFPLISEAARKEFGNTIQSAADELFTGLRPALKKIRKAARKEKVEPWLYALVWSEILDSKLTEESLVDAGALDPMRLRNEGYLWLLLPADPFTTGAERYSSGDATLHYLWTPFSPFTTVLQSYPTRRRLLDGALGHTPWDQEETRDILAQTGILDAGKQVRIPVLRKNSRLLAELRTASQAYAKDLLRKLKPEPLSRSLGVTRDEAMAAAFAGTGYRVLERAVGESFIARPEFLSRPDAPMSGLVETLVITANDGFEPLERSFYLYDREDFAGSIQMADRFLGTHPGDPEALFRKGMALMKQRKYPEALETFEKAAARPAEKGDVWRGWTLIRAGNIYDVLLRRDEALKRYTEALAYADVAGSHQIARNWLENVYHD